MAAAAQSQVVLELLLQDKQFVGQVKEAVRNLAKIGKEADKSGGFIDKMPAGLSKLAGGVTRTIGLIGGLVAAAGTVASAFGFAKAIQAAQEQEDALNKVAFALRNTGEFSKEALADVAAFSEALQTQKGIADETVLELFALAKNYGATKDQAKLLTDAAVELSAVTGKDVTASMELLGKTLSGNVGRLKTLNPEFAKLNEYQLKAGEAARVVLNLYGGAAAAQLQTFSGAVRSAKLSFGELLEELGNIVIKNPAVIAVIQKVGAAFQTFAGFIKDNAGEIRRFTTDGLKSMIRTMGNLLLAISALDVGNPFAGMAEGLGRMDTLATRVVDSLFEMEAALLRVQLAYFKSPLSAVGPGLGYGGKTAAEAISDLNGQLDTLFQKRQDLANAGEQLKFPDAFKGLETGDGPKKGIDKITDSIKDLLATLDKLPDTVEGPAVVGPQGMAGGGGGGSGGGYATNPNAASDGKSMFDFDYLTNSALRAGDMLSKLADRGPELISSFVQAVGRGREGAADVVSGGIGMLTEVFAPGFGQMAGEIAKVLSADPEAFKAQIQAFIEGVPDVIDAIIENIPVLVTTLAENSGEIITALAAASPQIALALAKAMPGVARALLTELFNGLAYQFGKLNGAFTNFQNSVHNAGAQFAEAFKKIDLKQLFKNGLTGLKDAIVPIFTGIGDTIKGAIAGAGSAFLAAIIQAGRDFANAIKPGGKSGGYIGQAKGKAKATWDNIRGAATGGMVSGGSGMKDDQLFALKRGELIIDPPLTKKLDAALSNGRAIGAGGGDMAMSVMLREILAELKKPITVQTSVSLKNKVFAEIALELARTNARVA